MIGLFFGSFNPIHNGHLAIARYLLEESYCSAVWFVVSPHNPLKEQKELLDEEKRLQIVHEAIMSDSRMHTCDIEFGMPRPSYTFETLQLLEQKYPHEEFALIIGGDNLRDFCFWKNYQMIAENYPILVYPRPDILISGSEWENVKLVDAPLSDISSTEIRQKIRQEEDITEYVPENVVHLIYRYYQ